MDWRRGLQSVVVVASSIPVCGCFALGAERLPPRAAMEEWGPIRERLAPGAGGILVWEGARSHATRASIEASLTGSGLFREVRRAGPDGVPDLASAAWVVRHECQWRSEGASLVRCVSPLTVLTLGLVPQWSTWEVLDIYRVSRAEDPERPVAWVGVPGDGGWCIGLAALVLSALPDWEIVESGADPDGPIMGEHLALNLGKVLAAHAEGITPTTDPEVLRKLREVKEANQRDSRHQEQD